MNATHLSMGAAHAAWADGEADGEGSLLQILQLPANCMLMARPPAPNPLHLLAQAHQLKSFRPPKGQQFVALLVPQTLPPPGWVLP